MFYCIQSFRKHYSSHILLKKFFKIHIVPIRTFFKCFIYSFIYSNRQSRWETDASSVYNAGRASFSSKVISTFSKRTLSACRT